MSQNSSTSSSRAQSPSIRSRTPTPIPKIPKKQKTNNIDQKMNDSTIFLFCFISSMVYVFFIKDPPYCSDGFNSHCVKCPNHGKCGIYSLKCEKGYKQVDRFCINKTSTDINKLREIKNKVKKETNSNSTTFSIETGDLDQKVVIDYLLSTGIIEEKGENQYSPVKFSIVKFMFLVSASITIFFFLLLNDILNILLVILLILFLFIDFLFLFIK